MDDMDGKEIIKHCFKGRLVKNDSDTPTGDKTATVFTKKVGFFKPTKYYIAWIEPAGGESFVLGYTSIYIDNNWTRPKPMTLSRISEIMWDF